MKYRFDPGKLYYNTGEVGMYYFDLVGDTFVRRDVKIFKEKEYFVFIKQEKILDSYASKFHIVLIFLYGDKYVGRFFPVNFAEKAVKTSELFTKFEEVE